MPDADCFQFDMAGSTWKGCALEEACNYDSQERYVGERRTLALCIRSLLVKVYSSIPHLLNQMSKWMSKSIIDSLTSSLLALNLKYFSRSRFVCLEPSIDISYTTSTPYLGVLLSCYRSGQKGKSAQAGTSLATNRVLRTYDVRFMSFSARCS